MPNLSFFSDNNSTFIFPGNFLTISYNICAEVVTVPNCATSDLSNSIFSITAISISVAVKYTPSSLASINTFDKIGIVFRLSTTE